MHTTPVAKVAGDVGLMMRWTDYYYCGHFFLPGRLLHLHLPSPSLRFTSGSNAYMRPAVGASAERAKTSPPSPAAPFCPPLPRAGAVAQPSGATMAWHGINMCCMHSRLIATIHDAQAIMLIYTNKHPSQCTNFQNLTCSSFHYNSIDYQ